MKSSGKIPLCKAAALQSLMRRDQFYKQKFDKNQEHSLESLKKRQNEINAILMNSWRNNKKGGFWSSYWIYTLIIVRVQMIDF